MDTNKAAKFVSELTYVSPHDPLWKQRAMKVIEIFTGKRTIEKLYQKVLELDVKPIELWKESIGIMKLQPEYDIKQVNKIPAEGPLVIIANHPFGVVDGLILGHIVSQRRKEFVFLVYDILCRQDERINQFLLPVDFRTTKEATRTNLETRRKAIEQLDQGGTMIIFPAGGVSTAPGGFGKAEDLEWKRFVIKVVQRSKATVVPMFFHGQNSRLFHIFSQFSTTLRLGMLLYEVKNKQGKRIKVEIGNPIPYEQLPKYKNKQDLLDYLKKVTYDLEKN